MSIVHTRARRAVPTAFALLTLLSVGVLIVCDAIPPLFPARAHDFCAAIPLVGIALVHVTYQAVRRAPPIEWAKTMLIALAFLFWAASLLCQSRSLASLFDDIAIAGFVFDGLLVIVGSPPGSIHAEGKTANAAKAALPAEPLAGE